MARLRAPQLPTNSGNVDLARSLTLTLRSIIDQLNSLSDGNVIACTTADRGPPSSGQHAQGDFIRNTQPAPGGAFGWVCIASGTPGTWKPVSIGE